MTDMTPRHPGRHTDGACIDNPGPGDWAAVLQSMDGSKELKRTTVSGSNRETTNNQMELTVAIEGCEDDQE